MDFNQLEMDIRDEINRVRENPQEIIGELQECLKNFKGKYYKIPGTNVNIVTHEGADAVIDALNELKNAHACVSLKESKGLYLASRDHSEDLGKSGRTSHTGTDGSRMNERIERYGDWDHSIAENIAFDDDHAKDIVYGMLIDDGNKTRGHRRNILNPHFQYFGIACHQHSKHKMVTVIDFAVQYLDKSDEPEEEQPKGTIHRKTVIADESIQKGDQRITQTSGPRTTSGISMSKNRADSAMSRNDQNDDTHSKSSYQAKETEDRERMTETMPAKQSRFAEPKPSQQREFSNTMGREPSFGQPSQSRYENEQPTGSFNSKYTAPAQEKIQEDESHEYKFTKPLRETYSDLFNYDFENDKDRPAGAVSMRIKRAIKTQGNKRVVKITKMFKMENGETEVVELIDYEDL